LSITTSQLDKLARQFIKQKRLKAIKMAEPSGSAIEERLTLY
jgi:hypothetical protein